MTQFAEKTTVSVEKSRAEIEGMLVRYGCDDFGYRIASAGAVLTFEVAGRRVRFTLILPSRDDAKFSKKIVRGSWKAMTPDERLKAWEQECRRLWRALALSIKGKLEAVASGIAVFEDEFLANVVDPVTGHTAAEIVRPWLSARYAGLPAPEGSPIASLALPAPGDGR